MPMPSWAVKSGSFRSDNGMVTGRVLTSVERDGLNLGDWGRLEIPDLEHVRIRNTAGKVRDISAKGLLRFGTNITGWFEPEHGIAVLGGPSTELLRIDFATDEATVVATLDRDPDEDLRFVSFHEVGSGVLCLYERGVVFLDMDGHSLWLAKHEDISAKFDGARDGMAWFRSQWPPDQVGHRFAIRLSDGKQVSG